MSATPKDLQYYLSHTDEMPTDPAEIERLAAEATNAALESGTENLTVDKIVGKQDEPAPVQAETETKTKAEVKVDSKAEETPKEPEITPLPSTPEIEAAKAKALAEGKPWIDGVLSKGGLNVIPYSQLESARARATAAEALAKIQAAELTALRAAKAAPQQQEDEAVLTDAELEALEADSPTLAKTLRAQQAAIQALRNEITNVIKTQEAIVESETTVIKSEIQTAIDSIPSLAAWQSAEDQTLWNEASRFDRLLRESPKYADVPFEERFKKVVELTQVSMGLEPETKPEPPAALSQEDIKAAAQAKLAAAAKAKRPVSLSDIPGGAPPAVDEKAKVEDASIVALGQQFLGMTKDQLDAYLASL
jgi:hypothetical protein